MSKKRQSRKRPRQRAASRATEASRFSQKEFNPDYSQTIKDLKRIGMLAGSFFVILLALSFFLR